MTSSGLLLVDKPSGITSHDVVARLRQLFHERRIGHAGTLDPLATGLLVVAVGPSTRLLRFAQSQVKRYSGTVRLGEATDSLDADGVVVATGPVPEVTTEELNALAATMCGPQQQVPPMVSAIKVRGRRLHEMAREGIEIERAPRDIVIDALALRPGDDPRDWDFDVTCSVGTYVRVLMSELADKLGTVGHLRALRRVASGHHRVEDAYTLDALAALEDVATALAPAASMLADVESCVLATSDVAKMRMGQRVTLSTPYGHDEIAAFDEHGELVGVLRRRGEVWKPEIVLSTPKGIE